MRFDIARSWFKRAGLVSVLAAALALSACETIDAPADSAAAPAAAAAAGPAPLSAPPPRPPAPHMPANLMPEGVAAADEFLWLEEVNGKKAMDWVKDQNKQARDVLDKDPRYPKLREAALDILTAQDRIATPAFRAGGIDNFWQDKKRVRGVWRRTNMDSYRSDAPAWQTILDIDALARSEGANWIFKGADCLLPEETLCLVSLSNGGKDAAVVREYDVTKKRFVRGGFRLPEGKHRIAWQDKDTLLVATNFGEGTLTESGYPYIVKALKRGQPLAEASEVYRGAKTDGGYGVSPLVLHDSKGAVLAVLASRPLDTFRSETWEIQAGKSAKLNLPERVRVHGAMAAIGGAPPKLVFSIAEAWTIERQKAVSGSLMAVSLRMLRTLRPGEIVLTENDMSVFEPTARQSIEEIEVFDDRILASVYDNVRGRVVMFHDKGKTWPQTPLQTPENVAVHLGSASRSEGRLFYSYEGFLTPSTLSLVDVMTGKTEVLRQAPERFDASRHVVTQYEAASADGVRIPYFVVRPKDAPLDGSTPTMLFGYGGFQASFPPVYKPELGKLWLEHGGAYVIANIRGGGEFGPAWHQAALKEKRQRAFDDFAAVARDLETRKITSARRLAIYGRSNGGVLTSVTLTQHPELINAAVIESPLVDMMRYHELPPGASWMGEYGDPRIADDASWIATYSAYQNLRPSMKYPKSYITTNTRDDRVHPGHARKFAARLQAMGYEAIYFENTDGGHANDSDPILNAERWARHYTYLFQQLTDTPPAP